MNYIWELAVRAIQAGTGYDGITFKKGQPFSPYMELCFENLNEKNVVSEAKVNPYYRFYSIYKELFEPNLGEDAELVDTIFDITLHHLTAIDLNMGMNRREYYIKFVIQDMENGRFGRYIQENIRVFLRQEQKILAEHLLVLYATGEGVFLMKETVRRIFPGVYIFSNAEDKDEITIFMRTPETAEKLRKIQIIQYLFLPFKSTIELYWENIFGILGEDTLMRLGEMLNY